MSVSQNGFPGLDSGSGLLHKWVVPGTQRYFVLRTGSAGFLLCHFILWFHEKVEKLNKTGEVWDEWAYAYRPIRGQTTVISNHGSGTAVDLNATKHPLGLTGTFGVVARAKIRLRLAFYLNCIRWGGDYTGRKDEMHFEINRDLRACEKLARRLANTKRGRRILNMNPGQRAIIFS